MIYSVKRFSLQDSINSVKMVHSWGKNRRRIIDNIPSDDTYYEIYDNGDRTQDYIASGEYGKSRKLKEKLDILRHTELSPKKYRKAYKLSKESKFNEDCQLHYDKKGNYRYKEIQDREKEKMKDFRKNRLNDPERKSKSSFRDRVDETGVYRTEIDPKTRKAIGPERKL